ncbi:MAG TPA: hypothetical protein VK678_07795, partial [Bradyrhizobium sp.]|nr:hypothetical protein [Bradyrhizobium sp.]
MTTTAGIALGGFGGWAEANDYIVANSSEAMEALQKAHYSQTSLADINESFKAQKVFTSCDWKRLLLRRHGHQLAAAIDRLLHGECRALRRHQQECTAHAGHFRSRQRPNGHCRLPSPS